MKQLADSLQTHGTLQPILVRAVGDGYELIAGERRWRAARLAGLTQIPAVVREVGDDDVLELSLVENLLREDLNPIDKARAYRSIHVEHGLSHEEIGRRMSEDRRTVAHAIQLLDLGADAQRLIESGALSASHGKLLLGVGDVAAQSELARLTVEKNWSVRYLATRIDHHKQNWSAQTVAPSAHPDEPLLDRLAELIRVKVAGRSRRGRPQCGSIRLEYRNVEEKRRVFEWLKRALEAGK